MRVRVANLTDKRTRRGAVRLEGVNMKTGEVVFEDAKGLRRVRPGKSSTRSFRVTVPGDAAAAIEWRASVAIGDDTKGTGTAYTVLRAE